jgi:uncharacterized Zn-binding protein involved in type VI secretion
MPAVQRDGDANSGGGVAQGGVGTVRVNGKSIMVPGQSVTPHPPYGPKGRKTPHNDGSQITAGGSGTVRAGGQAVVRTGDADSCGHARAGGSPNVRAG